MENRAGYRPEHQKDRRFIFILVILLIFSLTVNIAAYYFSTQALNRERLKIFEQTSERVQQWVEERMLVHVTILHGLQAFWARHPEGVSKKQFSVYVNSLNILSDYPSISSVAFLKRDGDKLITTYIEPVAGRETALGFDQNTNPHRKEFLEWVRDSGKITSSRPLTFMTTDQSGIFLTAPLYAGGTVPRSASERQEKLIGFVNLAFRDAELFTAIFGRQNPTPDIDFAIYPENHTGEPNSKYLLFDSDPSFDPEAFSDLPQIKKFITVDQNLWTIIITAKPSFSLTAAEENLPRVMLIIGLSLCAIFDLVILFFYRRHLKTWHS